MSRDAAPLPEVTGLERETLEVVWDRGEAGATVRDVAWIRRTRTSSMVDQDAASAGRTR